MTPEAEFLLMTPDAVLAECEREYGAVIDLIEESDVVVDLGANIGGFARLCPTTARLICVEPLPANVAHLEASVPDAEVWAGALVPDGSDDTVELLVPCNRGEYAGSTTPSLVPFDERLTPEDRAVETVCIRVPAIPVSDVIAAKPTVVKMDIEGAEAFLPVEQMLDGVRLIAIELHGLDDFSTQRAAEIASYVERHYDIVSGSTALSPSFPQNAVFVGVRRTDWQDVAAAMRTQVWAGT